MSSCSSRATRSPRSAASWAIPSPLTPAPMTTTSKAARKGSDTDSPSMGCSLFRGPSGRLDHGDDGADLDRLALGHEDLAEGAGGRRLQRLLDLLGLDLGQRLVLGDAVA